MNIHKRGAAILALLSVAGCAGQQAVMVAPLDCAGMMGATVAAADIGLPTSGAVVTAATVIPAAGAGAKALPEYCKVLGSIAPVNPASPPINFELDLPVAWNGKALMFGGGGFNGSIPNTAGNVSAGPVDQPAPLGRGYAVFASDSGHQSKLAARAGMDASFALDAEATLNFTGDALKKTRDVAMQLIRQRYAVSGVKRAYFAGGSTGGREALEVVQRWPQDWDGAISWYPAWNHMTVVLQAGRVARALAAPGGWLDPAKRKLLYDAALKTCDGLDGVADGLIGNVAACNAKFDPAKLRCKGGKDRGDACLSDAQLKTVLAFNAPLKFDRPLASGETGYPGYNIYGADLGMPNDKPLQPLVILLALGSTPPGVPPLAGQSPSVSVFWDQWVRYVIAGDANYDALALDPVTGGALRPRIDELSKLIDMNATDYSAFAARGGKLLLAHGSADILVSARSTGEYYTRVQAAMGADKAHGFMRYYEVPSYGHGASTVFNAAWDSLTALDEWADGGKAPAGQVVTDSMGVPGRTRPLCEYPLWPKYRGAGDVNAAASFVCADH